MFDIPQCNIKIRQLYLLILQEMVVVIKIIFITKLSKKKKKLVKVRNGGDNYRDRFSAQHRTIQVRGISQRSNEQSIQRKFAFYIGKKLVGEKNTFLTKVQEIVLKPNDAKGTLFVSKTEFTNLFCSLSCIICKIMLYAK